MRLHDPLGVRPTFLEVSETASAKTASTNVSVSTFGVAKMVFLTPAVFVIFVGFRGSRSKIPCFFLWAECNIGFFANFRQNHLFSAGDKTTVFQNDRFDNPETLGVSRWAPFVSLTDPELSSIKLHFPQELSSIKPNCSAFALESLWTHRHYQVPLGSSQNKTRDIWATKGAQRKTLNRRCGVDTEILYGLFCRVLQVRVASGVDTEFLYRVRIVDRGVDCHDPVCRHRLQ